MVNLYKVTYRTTRGDVQNVLIKAIDESSARSAFYMRYDGRLLVIALIDGIDDSQ